jgi:hypothetical protein
MRSRIAVVVVLLVVITACSVSETISQPSCSAGNTSALVVAQSVATATFIPCFEDLPAGWEVDSADITQAGTTIAIDSDRAGFSAATLRFQSACDTAGAVATPSDYDGTERFELIHQISPRFQADRFYLFEGGCIWWQFDFDIGVPSAMSVELGNSLVLFDRTEFNDSLRLTSVDEDL